MVLRINKLEVRSSYENHREIRLVRMVSKPLADIVFGRLSSIRKRCMRANKAGRDSIDEIFTLRQILGYNHMVRRPMIAVFLDLKQRPS